MHLDIHVPLFLIKQSIQQVCSHQGGEGRHEDPRNTPAPTATATPGTGGGPTFDQLLGGLRSCFAQFHTPSNNNPDACVSCVNAQPTEGLEQTRLDATLTYARNICRGTFEHH